MCKRAQTVGIHAENSARPPRASTCLRGASLEPAWKTCGGRASATIRHDAAHQALVYVIYSREVVEGSAKMDISTVALHGAEVTWANGANQ